jgi:flavorubredoxin
MFKISKNFFCKIKIYVSKTIQNILSLLFNGKENKFKEIKNENNKMINNMIVKFIRIFIFKLLTIIFLFLKKKKILFFEYLFLLLN